MSSVSQNWFEIERRAILWSPLTTLNDGTTSLGWDDNPNNVVDGNTPGESWLYSLPIGQFYKQSDAILWWKSENPNTWIELGNGGNDNFSYENIQVPLTIPLYQQMIVMGEFIVEDDLIIEGTLILEI